MTSTVVSNSQITCFKRCKRKYWLGYVRKLKLRRYGKTGARQLGTRVHGALQAFYNLEGKAGRIAALEWLEALRLQELASITTDNGDVDGIVAAAIAKEHELAVIMIEGYCDWVDETGADEDIEVVETEAAIRAPSPYPGVELIGKFDILLRKISTGDLGFLDHKTVGDLQGPLKTLGMDEQFRQYALMLAILAAQRGETPVRFQTYNMLKKVKRTVKAKPPFYDRHDVYINDAELRQFYHRIYGEIRDLIEFEQRLETDTSLHHIAVAYPSPRNECSWDCDFFAICPLFDDSHADPEYVLSENFVEGDPHEHYEGKLTTVGGATLVQSAARDERVQ